MFNTSSVMFKLTLAFVVIACVVQADEEYTERVRRSETRFRRQSAGELPGPFNRTLRIVTIDHEPFTIISRTVGSSKENEYAGFIPDFIELLAKRLHFTYTLYNVSGYGRYNSTLGQWTGMIGEVVLNDESSGRNGADIAAGALTITRAREGVVNFLKPFQHSGLSAIVRRPFTPVENPFTFGIFQPMQPTVWCLILLSSGVVALFLWAMNMYNPYEWANRYSLGLTDVEHSEMFNLKGSVWFVFTSLQWQGFERAPNSIASKFLGCVWFAFVTVVVVTYTAGIVNNLYWASMAHRSIQNPVRPRYVDLAHAIQSGDFKFGAVINSQTYRYIMEVTRSTELGVIRRYWETAEGQAQLVSNVDEGLKKVRAQDSNYVFLMESLFAKFHASRSPCDLVTVGEPFGARSYGFALPTAIPSSWSDRLHETVQELIEEGEIEDLERKWFTDVGECWNMTIVERYVNDALSTISVSRPRRIDVSTFTGPLVMIIVGLLLSVGIAIAEIVYYRRYGRYQSGNRPKRQLEMHPEDGNI